MLQKKMDIEVITSEPHVTITMVYNVMVTRQPDLTLDLDINCV